MQELFSYIPEACANTLEIVKKCNVELELGKYHFPAFKTPGDIPLHEHLENLSRKGFQDRLPFILKRYPKADHDKMIMEYSGRLENELAIIRATGFSGYFLIVYDFVNYAKNQNIPVGPGRGSAAGSLAAYALKITDIDPIPYDLLFERFLNPERISLPDIDVDFCIEGRDKVIKYVSEKYGKGSTGIFDTRVSQIITFGKMQAKGVIRDVGRALDMPYGEVDKIAKLVPHMVLLEPAGNQYMEDLDRAGGMPAVVQEQERTCPQSYKNHKCLVEINSGHLGGVQAQEFQTESSDGIHDHIDAE